MEKLKFFGKKILVVGLGITGKSVIAYLYNKNTQIVAYDLNLNSQMFNFFESQYPKIDLVSGELLNVIINYNFDYIALSPGISRYDIAIVKAQHKGAKIISDIEIFLHEFERNSTKIIAITGSNGKSTVTKLCGFLCKENGLRAIEAGNIGKPVLEVLEFYKNNFPDVLILELSSFQLENISDLSADVATCLNISQDHLDRYLDLLEYAYVKDKIFNGVKVQVLNADDILCQSMARKNVKTVRISVNNDNNCDYWIDSCQNEINLIHLGNKIASMDKFSIYGIHNAFNILTALALCENIGLDIKQMINKLPRFKGLAHRIEKITSINGITFIDDSKGTNVDATCAAINSINQPIILIAGGLGKDQDFSKLASLINKKIKKVFLIGADAQIIANELLNLNFNDFTICASLEEATLSAFNKANNNYTILLSPACSSYDMFNDYVHRAQVFIKAIDKIKLLNV